MHILWTSKIKKGLGMYDKAHAYSLDSRSYKSKKTIF